MGKSDSQSGTPWFRPSERSEAAILGASAVRPAEVFSWLTAGRPIGNKIGNPVTINFFGGKKVGRGNGVVDQACRCARVSSQFARQHIKGCQRSCHFATEQASSKLSRHVINYATKLCSAETSAANLADSTSYSGSESGLLLNLKTAN